MNKTKITIIVLAVLLIIAVGYIGATEFGKAKDARERAIFEQGANMGFEQAITSIMQQASTCQPVPLYIGNNSLNLVAVECLNITKE